MVNHPIEIKITKEALAWWKEFEELRHQEIDNINIRSKLLYFGVVIGSVATAVATGGFGLASIFFGILLSFIPNLLVGRARIQQIDYYLWDRFHEPQRYFLSAFIFTGPDDPAMSLADISQIINKGISSGPWDTNGGRHRFKVTSQLDDLVLGSHHIAP